MLHPIKITTLEELHETETFADNMLCGDADEKMLSMSMRCDALQSRNTNTHKKNII